MKYLIFSLTALVLFSGCRPESPKRASGPETVAAVEMGVDRQQIDGTPKVDILIVVDNSLSMEHHQYNLAKNVDKFVSGIAANKTIDFHIGVTAIWDQVHLPQIQNYDFPLGHLVPLRSAEDNTAPPTQKERDGVKVILPQVQTKLFVPPSSDISSTYVTRNTPDLEKVLAHTMYLGTESGPEFEEMFSPIEAALPINSNSVSNGDFYRPEAHLLVIIITDADDGTMDVPPEKLYTDLLNLKNGDKEKLMLAGAIIPIEEGNKCRRDQAGPPFKIQSLLKMSGGSVFDLCSSNFGQELADFGKELKNRVGSQLIKLPAVPDPTTLQVHFGSQLIPYQSKGGWLFDNQHNTILVSPDLKVNDEAGARLLIDYTPVKLENVQNGRAHPMVFNTAQPSASPSPSPSASPAN